MHIVLTHLKQENLILSKLNDLDEFVRTQGLKLNELGEVVRAQDSKLNELGEVVRAQDPKLNELGEVVRAQDSKLDKVVRVQEALIKNQNMLDNNQKNIEKFLKIMARTV